MRFCAYCIYTALLISIYHTVQVQDETGVATKYIEGSDIVRAGTATYPMLENVERSPTHTLGFFRN